MSNPASIGPRGHRARSAKGISDDGRTVQYQLRGARPIERFVDLDAAQAVDRPNLDGTQGDLGYVIDRFVHTASGNAFVHVHEVGEFEPSCGYSIIDESWAERLLSPPVRSGGATRTRVASRSTGRHSLPPTATSHGSTSRAANAARTCPRRCSAMSPRRPTPLGRTASALRHRSKPARRGRHLLERAVTPHRQAGVSAAYPFFTPRACASDRLDHRKRRDARSGRNIRGDQRSHVSPRRNAASALHAVGLVGRRAGERDLQVAGTTTSTGAGWYEYSVAPPSPMSSTSPSLS